MKYPEGYFVNQWMAIGISFGIIIGLPIGIAIGNPGLFGIGLPIGMAIGIAIGQSKENKYRKEGKIRPLTKNELKRKRVLLIIFMIILLAGLAAGVLTFLLSRR